MEKMKKFFFHPVALLTYRVLVGSVFLLFGIAKALAPAEQFYESIREYQMLPEIIVPFFGSAMIYIEIIVGIGLIMGIYTRYATWGVAGMLVLFLIAIGQAMVRGLELPSCGCGADFFELGETPMEVWLRDWVMLAMVIPLLIKQKQKDIRLPFTCDKWFER